MHLLFALAAPPLVGVAHDAKAGAGLLTPDGVFIYVDGLPSWPDDLLGQPVTASGRRAQEARLPAAWAGGEAQQGAVDPVVEVLLDATYAAAPWQVDVSDGSGNHTRIDRQLDAITWSYRPVTRAESSSGEYSGGEPAAGEWTTADARALWAEVDRLLLSATPDAPRAMGTYRIAVTAPWGRREAIVAADAAAALERHLAGVRARRPPLSEPGDRSP